MLKLLVHIKKYKKECILGPLFKLLEALLELFVPLVIASIIDDGIANGDKGYVIGMVCLLVGLGIVGLSFSITDRPAVLGHGAVLCRQGGGRVLLQGEARIIPPH